MKKNRKRIVAAFMTVLMALTLVPTWLLGGAFATTAKAAGETKHTLNASDLTAKDDKEKIPDGEVLEEYFTSYAKGGNFNVVKRTSSSTGKVTSVEVGQYKAADNCSGLQFILPLCSPTKSS